MPIKLIKTNSQPPLGDFLISFDGRVNLFIGPNASGKSTILREMKRFYSVGPDRVSHFEREEELLEEVKRCFNIQKQADELERMRESPPLFVELVQERADLLDQLNERAVRRANLYFYKSRDSIHEHRHIYCSTHMDWDQKFFVIEDTSGFEPTTWDTAPLLYIPAIRINVTDHGSIEKDDSSGEYWIEGLLETRHGSFYSQGVELAIDGLRKEMVGNRGQQYQLRRALEVGYSCAKSICAEVIYDNEPHTFIELREVEDPDFHEIVEEYGLRDMEKINHYAMGIGTNDNITGEPLYAGVLSSGTQGTLLWVWALALKMAHHYGWEKGWEEKPAILLIDEIENHLHPTWQRRVIPALLEHFPRLQIFATTHSPFVVAGLTAGQVHLLNRDQNGAVTVTTNERDVIGWTADEILRTMMGVEEPTDQRTVDRANRLRQLREKETLTPEEESEMNELRRQVNEDLLSKGGPLEVQRDRYADLMQNFLLSRQSELSQDGE